MIINGTTQILTVDGKLTRVCGHDFNQALKRFGREMSVSLPTGEPIKLSGNHDWKSVAKAIRAGKTVRAAVVGAKLARKAA